MLKDSIDKAVAEYFEAIRALDADRWVATFAENGVSLDPYGSQELVGPDALRQFFLGIAGGFETLSFKEDSVFVSGDRAAVKWTASGVGKNGKPVTFEGIDVFEVNDAGKIQTVWGYWDPGEMMATLAQP